MVWIDNLSLFFAFTFTRGQRLSFSGPLGLQKGVTYAGVHLGKVFLTDSLPILQYDLMPVDCFYLCTSQLLGIRAQSCQAWLCV